MVKLYEHPLSPYAQKVKIALAEKGIAYETELPAIVGGNVGEFSALNPRLEVPTLVDGDVRVFDSTVILEYLEDRWPTPSLLPKTPAERARVRMLEEVCDTYYEAINWAGFEMRIFQRAEGGLAERLLARAAQQIAGVHAYLERQLGPSPFFNGDAFGWGDLSVVPHVQASAMSGTPPPAGSRLAAWLERVVTRPSVAGAFEAAVASMAGFEMLPQLIASGQFVREYRDHRVEWMLRSGGTEIVLDGMRKGNIRFSVELA
jgi:glutathione S-transferase/RNA polymerase-associated protein